MCFPTYKIFFDDSPKKTHIFVFLFYDKVTIFSTPNKKNGGEKAHPSLLMLLGINNVAVTTGVGRQGLACQWQWQSRNLSFRPSASLESMPEDYDRKMTQYTGAPQPISLVLIQKHTPERKRGSSMQLDDYSIPTTHEKAETHKKVMD